MTAGQQTGRIPAEENESMAEVITRGEMAVFSKTGESAVICLSGNWKRSAELPGAETFRRRPGQH